MGLQVNHKLRPWIVSLWSKSLIITITIIVIIIVIIIIVIIIVIIIIIIDTIAISNHVIPDCFLLTFARSYEKSVLINVVVVWEPNVK